MTYSFRATSLLAAAALLVQQAASQATELLTCQAEAQPFFHDISAAGCTVAAALMAAQAGILYAAYKQISNPTVITPATPNLLPGNTAPQQASTETPPQEPAHYSRPG